MISRSNKKRDIETRITQRELLPVSTSTDPFSFFFFFFCPAGQIRFKIGKQGCKSFEKINTFTGN
jgi:hypothetical protein